MDVQAQGTSTKGLWEKAIFRARKSVAFSQSFHTLRDMVQDIYIEPSALEHVKSIGEGAFASVSMTLLDGRAVAAKHLKPSLLESDRDLADFLNEAALLKKLRHASVVNFVGVAIEIESPETSSSQQSTLKPSKSMGQRAVDSMVQLLRLKKAKSALEDGTTTEEKTDAVSTEQPVATQSEQQAVRLKSVVLVQEYMSRGTLKSIVLQQMKYPLRPIYKREDALEWLIQIAQGLRYLHESQPRIIHRDLKLENLMLTLNAQDKVVAKIGDFGLHSVLKDPKRVFEPFDVEDDTVFVSSTASGKKAKQTSIKASYALSGKTGSFMYMAPEVLNSQPYNEKADVFSFSLIMYELFSKAVLLCFVSCTGEPDEIENYAKSIARGNRPAVPEEWPENVKQLIRRCWAHSPVDRPTMAEVVTDLKQMKDSDWILQDQKASCSCCALQ